MADELRDTVDNAVEEIKESFKQAFGDGYDMDGDIKLAPLDCAIVFRYQDGIGYPELFLPHYESGEDKVSTVATLCSIIAMRMSDPAFIYDCYEWMDAKMKEIEQENKEVSKDDEGRTD